MVFSLFAKKEPSASDHVEVTVVSRRPQAIIVILGWMGSSRKELDEYASLYHELQCSTVCVTAPTMSLAMHDTATLGELAVIAMRETARLVRMGEWSEMGQGHVPVIIHVLSHGGSQVLEELERRIREVVPTETPALLNNGDDTTCRLRGRPIIPSASKSATRKPSLTHSTNSSATEEISVATDELSEDGRRSQRWAPLLKASQVQHRISLFTLHPTQWERRQVWTRRTPIVNRFDVERNVTIKKEQLYNTHHKAYGRDLQLFASRLELGAIAFDSAPCFPSLQRELLAAEICLKLDPVMRVAAQSAIASKQGVNGIIHNPSLGRFLSPTGARVEVGRSEQFWRTLQDLSLTKRHAFIYGAADKVCDAWKLKELIDSQRYRGMSIIECSIGGTGHLEHKRRRIDLYSEFLGQILNSVCPKLSGDVNDEDWGWDDVGEKNAKKNLQVICLATKPTKVEGTECLNENFIQGCENGFQNLNLSGEQRVTLQLAPVTLPI